MSRGSTIEVVVSRMKACVSSNNDNENENKLRFIGVSATIPNISDVRINLFLCLVFIILMISTDR